MIRMTFLLQQREVTTSNQCLLLCVSACGLIRAASGVELEFKEHVKKNPCWNWWSLSNTSEWVFILSNGHRVPRTQSISWSACGNRRIGIDEKRMLQQCLSLLWMMMMMFGDVGDVGDVGDGVYDVWRKLLVGNVLGRAGHVRPHPREGLVCFWYVFWWISYRSKKMLVIHHHSTFAY